MSDRGTLLLIAYQFCPKGRIGTRRWSKFAKYLVRSGYTVHVLAARYPYEDTVNWCADVEGQPHLHIHHIPDAYPPALLRAERTWGLKFGERLLRSTLFPLEYAQHWGRWLLPAARKLIREQGIDCCVATGAPFTPFAAAVRLKEDFPDLRVFLDFRDPWSSRMSAADARSRRFKIRARQLEATAMQAADGVFFTTPEHLAHYADLHRVPREKLHLLPNGYDPRDFQTPIQKPPTNALHFVYPGAMMLNRLRVLADWLRALEDQAPPERLDQIKVDVFSTTAVPIDRLSPADQRLVHRYVRWCDPLPPSELNLRMQAYSHGLVLNNADHPYIVPAKTYTFMGLGLRIVYISPLTAMSAYLRKAGQFVATAEPAALAELAREIWANSLPETPDPVAYERFSIDRLTEILIARLRFADDATDNPFG